MGPIDTLDIFDIVFWRLFQIFGVNVEKIKRRKVQKVWVMDIRRQGKVFRNDVPYLNTVYSSSSDDISSSEESDGSSFSSSIIICGVGKVYHYHHKFQQA